MPLFKHYYKKMADASPLADLNNTAGRPGGACNAAAFLKVRFGRLKVRLCSSPNALMLRVIFQVQGLWRTRTVRSDDCFIVFGEWMKGYCLVGKRCLE